MAIMMTEIQALTAQNIGQNKGRTTSMTMSPHSNLTYHHIFSLLLLQVMNIRGMQLVPWQHHQG